MVYGYIYKIPFPNGKCYIGLTSRTIEERWKEHNKDAKAGDTKCLYNAIRKYDMIDTFQMIEIDTAETKEELCKKEIAHIEINNSNSAGINGYNMTDGGDGVFGYRHTDESKKKISYKSKQWRKENPEKAVERLAKATATLRSEAGRKKMSNAQKKSNIENTEKAREHSETMLMLFEDKNNQERRRVQGENVKKRLEDPLYKEQNAKRQTDVNQSLKSRRKKTAIPFVIYKKDGEYIGEYNYPCDAVEALFELELIDMKQKKRAPSKIKRVLNQENWNSTTTNKRYFWNKLFFKYISEIDDNWTFIKQLDYIKNEKKKRYIKPFNVYDACTKILIGEFELITDMCENLHLDYKKHQSNFSAVLNNRQKSAHGYFLEYKE